MQEDGMTTIVGVMSDTHSNIDLMNEIAHIMKEFGANMIFHLGDDMSDADKITVDGINIFSVPGIYEQAYTNPSVDNRKFITIENITFLLSHTPKKDGHDLQNDIDPEKALANKKADILLHGHTHIFGIDGYYDGYKVNPGHLKINDNRGCPPTFAIINVNKNCLNIKIIGIDGSIKLNQDLKVKK